MARTLVFGFALSQTLCLTANVNYKPDWDGGSGTWTDGTRYYEGRPPVAADKEILFFNPNKAAKPQPINVTLTDEDWQTLVSLGISRLQPSVASARVEMNFNEDVSWDGQLYGNGMFVKTGTGAFRLTRTNTAMSFGGRLVVSNGTFQVNGQYQSLVDGGMPIVEVQAPGVFSLASGITFWLKGLTGNGSVTCGNASGKLAFAGSSEEFVFTGTMLTNVSLAAGVQHELFKDKPKCRQIFACASHSFTPTLRLYAGTLGATTFGVRGSPSVFGDATGDGDRRFHVFDNSFRHAEQTILNVAQAPQTTDRIIRIMNGTGTNGVILTVDGGDYGALTWTGAFQNARAYNSQSQPVPMNYWDGHVTPIYLTGATTGGVCTIAGAVTEEVTTNHLFFTKRGSGTWRFAHNASRGFKTPIAVERGTLEYESIAEKGVNCSLGLATALTTNWTGFASALVPYAILLGDGSSATAPDLATFRYVGTTAASCSTRPIGILGAGRILDDNATASARLSDVSAASSTATLILDGTRTDSEIDNVTNGVGVLSLEKRGTGTWSLDGNLAYTGATTVKAGTLALKIAVPDYKWYRLTFKKVYGESQYNFHLQRMAFFSADGTDQALGLTYNSSANGNISSLQPGECAYGYSDTTCSKSLAGFFTTEGTEASVYRSSMPVVSLENENSWVSVVIRLPKSAQPVAKYDFVPGWLTNNNVPFGRTPTDWKLEGSADGVVWDVIDEQANQTRCHYDPKTGTGSKYWISDASLFASTPVPTAYPIETHGEQHYVKPTSLTAVSVAKDAVLTADGPLSTAKLTYNLTEGAGTISGLKFDAAGVLDVTGDVVCGKVLKLAYDLSDCSDVANLSSWQVSFNGQLKSGYSIVVRADGLEILPSGAMIIVR